MSNRFTGSVLTLVLVLVTVGCVSGFISRFSHKLLSSANTSLKMVAMTSEFVRPEYDTWIVGSGVLGTFITSQLNSQGAGMKIIAETRSDARKSEIEGMGVLHRMRDQRTDQDHSTARNVIICLPPSCSSSYADEVREATRLWAGKEAGGNLIYTSSIGVYGEAPGCIVTENTPVDDSQASVSKSRQAEQVVLAQGGSVVRLAGLYTATRGPHSFWLEKTRGAGASDGAQTVQQRGSSASLVNMVHYEDAATATIAAMKARELRGSVFLACDNEPVSRGEICLSALASGLYAGCTIPEFSSAEASTSKVCDSSLTRKLLGWEPQHTSFRVFMRRLGGENVADAPHKYTSK